MGDIFREIDEELRRSGIRQSRLGEGDIAPLIRLNDGVILNRVFSPFRLHVRVAADSHLSHEARDDSEESAVVVKTDFDQLQKSSGTIRCPGRMNGDIDVALAGFQSDENGLVISTTVPDTAIEGFGRWDRRRRSDIGSVHAAHAREHDGNSKY